MIFEFLFRENVMLESLDDACIFDDDDDQLTYRYVASCFKNVYASV